MYFLYAWIVLTQRWQRGNVGNAATLATLSLISNTPFRYQRKAVSLIVILRLSY